jgi:hypothetical protein
MRRRRSGDAVQRAVVVAPPGLGALRQRPGRLWLLFAPLVLWTPSAAAYLNDTLLGTLVIALAMLVRPVPGVGVAAAMTGPDIPPGWDFSPSSWLQRIPIIALAFVGLFISRYLAAYQLGHIDAAWDPFFGDGSERVITSEVSKPGRCRTPASARWSTCWRS